MPDLRTLLADWQDGVSDGPWHPDSDDHSPSANRGRWLDNDHGDSMWVSDEDLAHVVNALPRLLDVVEAARREHVPTSGVRSGCAMCIALDALDRLHEATEWEATDD